ncbi:MAG: tetratricopeptide repeat protein, partial [Thermodesulfobacteriota bacterium]|nr:tetratricopeptide repeat protein [Thermodesulfobacteriota bacterium]
RVLTQFRVVIYYLSLLVYPHPSRLNLDHDIGLSYSFIDPITTLISITAVLAMVGLAFYIARKDRLISFSILWFFGNLLIESSVIALEIMFEHRVYLPSMFFFLSIVVLAYRFIRPYWDWVVVVVLIAVALLFSMWTYERNSVWRDPITFWSDVVKKSPDKARPHNNLGIAYTEKGLIKKAIIEIKKAIDLKPGFVNAYVSLGNAYLNKGLFDMAIKEYRNALRLRSDYAEVYVNIGNAYIKKGTIDRAIESYSKALTLKPDSIRARFNIASAYGLKGFTKKVLAEYKALAELQPDNPDIHFNLGIAYERLAKSEDQRAERRGHVVMDQEQRWLIEQAVNEYKKALKLSPNDFQARRNIDRIKKWYKNQTAID